MPSSTIRREQSAEQHLLAAAEFIAIAESGDAEKSAYEHAAKEIIAAKEADPSLSNREIARRLGRDPSYVHDLVKWASAGFARSPFAHRSGSAARSNTRRVAREEPEAFVEAFEQAPPEARQRIAERLSQSPEVRVETRKHDVEQAERRKPSPVKPRVDHDLYEFESRLVSARRDLREALALVDRIDSTGDDEDVLDLIRDCEGLLSAVAEAYRSGKSIDTWAWELYERSA